MSVPDLALAESQREPRSRRPGEPQPAQVAVRPALVEEPRDGLLADVTALREAHRALVQPGLLGDHRVVEVDAVARPARLDAQDLGVGLARSPRRPPPRARRAPAPCRPPPHSTSTPRSVAISRTGAPAISAGAFASSSAGRAPERPRRRGCPARAARAARSGACACPAARRSRRARGGSRRRRPAARALHVEQQFVARVEDAQVAEHLALRRQHRSEHAVPGLERLDLVRDDPVQRGARLGAADREPAAVVRAIEDSGGCLHGSEDTPRPAGIFGRSRSKFRCAIIFSVDQVAQRPSPAVEDYAKAIYALERRADDGQVTTNALAERLGVTPGLRVRDGPAARRARASSRTSPTTASR